MSTTFRVAPPPEAPTTTLPDPEPNTTGAQADVHDIEPLEMREERSGDIVLEALGIEESTDALPDMDQENLGEVKRYVKDIMKNKGIEQTFGNFKQTLDSIKYEMGLSDNADPQVVLDRIGGVVKAWKQLSFISNPQEKRALFMKLAKQQSSKDMNRMIFDEMESRSVWQ